MSCVAVIRIVQSNTCWYCTGFFIDLIVLFKLENFGKTIPASVFGGSLAITLGDSFRVGNAGTLPALLFYWVVRLNDLK